MSLSAVNILLVGKTGSGKSSTLNSILGEAKALVEPGESVTKICQKYTTTRNGAVITVIDTPGICDTEELDAPRIIDDYITAQKCEVHAICLVLTASSRPTPEENSAISQLCKLFGHAMIQFLFIVVTRSWELEDKNYKTKDFVQGYVKDNKVLQACIQKDRVQVIENSSRNAAKDKQVQQLLDAINNMVSSNKGALYTLHNLEENKKRLEEEARKLREKENEMKRAKEEQRLREERAKQKAREDERKKIEAEQEEMKQREEKLRQEQERLKEKQRQHNENVNRMSWLEKLGGWISDRITAVKEFFVDLFT